MSIESLATDLNHQLQEAAGTREFAYSILEGEHKDDFHRKDYIALSLFNRCLQTHEAIEILVRKSLVDDAWVLVRVLVEHAVNSAYMLQVADARTADDFADYPDFRRYEELQSLKGTDESLIRQVVSVDEENELRQKFEAVRQRFDGRRGDRWSDDDRLHKRAARVDDKISEAKKEKHSEFKWLVNSVWRRSSSYVHGAADALTDQISETGEGVRIQRTYTREESARVTFSANLTLYLILLLVDLRLGGKNAENIKVRFAKWGGQENDYPPLPATNSPASNTS
jgi:hypothetical protein